MLGEYSVKEMCKVLLHINLDDLSNAERKFYFILQSIGCLSTNEHGDVILGPYWSLRREALR